ncbi:hypothetical protein GCM10027610_026490 [Dactylosporangium cerinum]
MRLAEDGTPLPAELATIDFAQLMRDAAIMSEGRLPATAAQESSRVEPDAGARAASVQEATEPVTPRAQDDGGRDRLRSKSPGEIGMPSDLAVVFWRLGSATKIAAHYAVPRQVAVEWISLLRNEGTAPNPWKRTGKTRRSR